MGIGPAIGGAIREGVEQGLGKLTAHSAAGEQVAKGVMQVPDILRRAFSRSGDVMDGWGGSAARLRANMGQVHESAVRVGADRIGRLDQWLDRMKDSDIPHLFDVMQGKAAPKSQLFADAKPVLRGLFNEVSDEAQNVGLQMIDGPKYQQKYEEFRNVEGDQHWEAMRKAMKYASKPFDPQENYMPYYYGAQKIHNLLYSKAGDKYIQQILDMNFATDRQTARAYLERSLRMPGEFRGGALQHVRHVLDIEPEMSKEVLRRYFFSASKRLESAKVFGPDDSIAEQMIEQASRENPKANKQFLANVYSGFMDATDPRYRDLARLTGTIHSLTLLSTAGIIQPAQLTNVVGSRGWGHTLNAMAQLLNDPETQAWAHSTGATLESISNQLMGGGLSDASKTWMKLIGLEKLDRGNRMVAAVAGSLHATELAKRLAANPLSSNAKNWVRTLEKLGLDAEGVLSRGGILTPEELKTAGLKSALETQFGSQAFDLPELRNTPAGDFMYMFKSFALQQSYYLKDLVKEAQQGNKAPIIRYLSAVAPAGLAYGPLLRAQKGRDAPDEWPAEFLEDLAWVGGGGAFFDAWRAMDNGPAAIFNWIAGPSASEAVQFAGADVPPIVKGAVSGEGPDFGPIVRHLVRRAPLAGPALYNLWFKN